jgi:OHCU decarboxylase|tara:strand:- start:4154 stop:4648 length:495 start_codon:yes stop_codon:yes gene_type:complete
MISLEKINNLNKSDFLTIFGNVFEKSEWISEKVFDLRPFKNFEDLFSKIIGIYENSDKKIILKILNSHPELAVEKKLTMNSKNEQKNANLNECTNDEYNEFKKLNIEYKKKFDFPFIIAVKGKNKDEILDYFRERIKNSLDEEFLEAKKQVKKIATFRLEEIIK